MRHGLLVPGIGLAIALALAAGVALHAGWLARAYDRATTAALTEDARLAIELRCSSQEGRAARECRAMLKRLFLAGSLDPDKTLRAYCDEVKHARWGGSLPPAPEVCVRRYGGWTEG